MIGMCWLQTKLSEHVVTVQEQYQGKEDTATEVMPLQITLGDDQPLVGQLPISRSEHCTAFLLWQLTDVPFMAAG